MGMNLFEGGGSGAADVLIKIKAQVEGLQDARSQIQKQMRQAKQAYAQGVSEIKKEMQRIRGMNITTVKGRQKKSQMLANYRTQLADLKVQSQKSMSTFQAALDGVNGEINTGRKRIKSLNAEVKKGMNQFPVWAISLMFFGQIMVQTFTNIWRASSRVFNDIAHSIRGTVTGFDRLTASMTYLGFVVGQALEPIAFFLVSIIDRISKWVSENENLVRVLMIVLGTVGALFSVVGILALGFNAIVTAVSTLSPALLAIGKAVAALGLIKVIAIIAAIIGILYILYVAWQENFGGIRDFVTETMGIVWSTIKGVFDSIKQILGGFLKIIRGIITGDISLIRSGVLDIIEGLVKALIHIVFGVVSVFQNVNTLILNIIIDLGKAILKLGVGIVEGFVDGLIKMAEIAINVVNAIIKAFNKVRGVNIPTINAEQSFKTIRNGLKTTKAFMDKTIDGMAETFKVDFISTDEMDKVKNMLLDGVSSVRAFVDSDISEIKDLPETEIVDNRIEVTGDLIVENNFSPAEMGESNTAIEKILASLESYR
jgi:hypothetical protein